MNESDWIVRCVYMRSPEDLHTVMNEVLPMAFQLRERNDLGSFYFNKYGDPQKDEYYVRLGFCKPNVYGSAQIEGTMDKLAEMDGVEKVVPAEPDLTPVDGKPVEELKCVACDLALALPETLTLNQQAITIHYFMNQLGYSYIQEIQVYTNLAGRLAGRLGESL